MSHFTTVQTRFKDRALLLVALGDLGIPYDDRPVRGWLGTQAQSDIRARLPGGYDIGFRQQGEQFQAVADFSMLGRDARDFLARLTQRYAYHATCRTLASQGFELVEETLENGSLHLLMRRMA